MWGGSQLGKMNTKVQGQNALKKASFGGYIFKRFQGRKAYGHRVCVRGRGRGSEIDNIHPCRKVYEKLRNQ